MLSSTMETLERRLLQWQATSSRWPSTSTSPRTQYRRQSSETKRADERRWTRWPSYLEVFKTKKLKAVHCSRLTLRIFLLLFPLSWVDDHPSLEALQETWRLLSLLDLNLKNPQKKQKMSKQSYSHKMKLQTKKGRKQISIPCKLGLSDALVVPVLHALHPAPPSWVLMFLSRWRWSCGPARRSSSTFPSPLLSSSAAPGSVSSQL